MDLVWIIPVLVILAAVAFAFILRRHQQLLQAAEQAHQETLTKVKEDSERRVSRIERASELALDRAEHALIRDLMPIADALMAAEGVSDLDAPSVKEGVRLVHREFDRVLEKHGVQKLIPKNGELFDPLEHEAVEQRDMDSGESNRIAQCFRPGFRQGDDVLRPAMVAVSRVATEFSFPEEDQGDEPAEEMHVMENHRIAKAD